MKWKKVTAILAAAMMVSGSGCEFAGAAEESGADAQAGKISLDAAERSSEWIYITQVEIQEQQGHGPGGNGGGQEEKEAKTKIVDVHPCYALKGVIYCANPVDERVQTLDIYVPEEYMEAEDNGNGTFTCSVKEEAVFERGAISYTAQTAPIIYQNTIDGYREGTSFNLADQRKGGPGTFGSYLDSGYIAVCANARGQNSEVDGTAPAAIVDLKAGVRYLKANDAVLPGDSNKICATGASAGGSLTAVLAASGNSPLYNIYLEEIGAAEETDDVYGALVFCPIANLEMGDAAFEYLHAGETSGSIGWGENAQQVEFDAFQTALHDALIEDYKEYIETLGMDSAQFRADFLTAINDSIAYYVNLYVEDKDAFAEENAALDREGDTFAAPDINTFVTSYMARKKLIPAFDSLDKTSTEAGLFDNEHFSSNTQEVLESLSGTLEEAGAYAEAYKADLTEERLEEVKLMSAMTFLSGEEESDAAPFWRFRNGTKDGDLGCIMGFTMNELLARNGYDTQYRLIWDQGHCAADYEYADVERYVDEICAAVSD